MIGYIHLAALDPVQRTPFLLTIQHVATITYNAILFPSRVDVLEEETFHHNPRRWRNRCGNLGTLRVLPTTVPRLPRAYIDQVDPKIFDFDAKDRNRTDYGGYFKHRNITLTLSPEVNLEPAEMLPVCNRLEQPVFVKVLKYSESRNAYQQIEIETKNPRLQFTASLSEEKEELDFAHWQERLNLHHMEFVMTEETSTIDPGLHADRLFGLVEHDTIEDDIIQTFQLPKLISVPEHRVYQPPE